MFTETEAKYKLLSLVNKPEYIGTCREFEIKYIHLSNCGDYWIMQANAIDINHITAGVAGYLLNNQTGDIRVCGGIESPESYLEDERNFKKAAGRTYVLVCDHSISDKNEIINMRRNFGILPREALYFTKVKPQWFKGSKRLLLYIQEILLEKGVRSKIELVENPEAVTEITIAPLWWSDMEAIFSEKFKI
ncbi:MAG: hypothetical protein V7785_20375 [Bermanella sp.]